MDNRIKTAIECVPSGHFVDLLAPDPALISLRDIGQSLGRIPRFTGHAIDDDHPHEVVAEHLLLTDWIGSHYLFIGSHYLFRSQPDALMRLHLLLHDAHEAYTGDISTPMKLAIGHDRIRPIEEKLDRAIYDALHLPLPTNDERRLVHLADNLALRASAVRRMPSRGRWAGPPGSPEIRVAAAQIDRLPKGRAAGDAWYRLMCELAPQARDEILRKNTEREKYQGSRP